MRPKPKPGKKTRAKEVRHFHPMNDLQYRDADSSPFTFDTINLCYCSLYFLFILSYTFNLFYCLCNFIY